jgi:hypothetical protein
VKREGTEAYLQPETDRREDQNRLQQPGCGQEPAQTQQEKLKKKKKKQQQQQSGYHPEQADRT